ncbi:hypothetical protein V3C99_005982 [Haemonchus contortus]
MSLKVRYTWTGDLREALAHSVKKREKLWKKVPVVSHDTELRAKLWAEVADELTQQFGIQVDTDDMKRTWKNLKDNYWRITRLYESDPLKPRRWRFYNCMRFMERANIDDSIDVDGQSSNQSISETSQARLEKARILIDGIAKRLRSEDQDAQLSGSDGGRSSQEGSESGGARNSLGQRLRDLIQISIPEIDRYIKTKQRPLTGAEVYCIPIEEVDDVLEKRLAKVWSELDANQERMEDQLDSEIDAMHVYQAENLITKPSDSNGAGVHLVRYDKKMRTETEKECRLIELIEIANRNYDINEETRYIVQQCASTLRGIYHQAAFALFMRQNMPSGQLQTLVDAFDEFVYNHVKPMNKVIAKVVKSCEPDKQKAFAALFSIIEKRGNIASLKCPDDRWAEIDNEARKNIDSLFARGRGKKGAASSAVQLNKDTAKSTRKRKKHVLTELGAEEQRRFTRMRAVLAKRIVEYVSAIESTKSLLEMVEPDDNETREELENTLRNVRQMHEKTKKDQERLEAQYKEFQNRSFGPRRKKRCSVDRSNTAHDDATVSTDDASSEPDPKPLFDTTVKVEPHN